MNAALQSRAWYREPMVWLLLGILALALAAGITILTYALRHPDAEVHSERKPQPAVTIALPDGRDKVQRA
jgi:hypothetical protein